MFLELNVSVESDESDVVLKRGRLVFGMDLFSLDAEVFVWKSLVLGTNVPFAKANLVEKEIL